MSDTPRTDEAKYHCTNAERYNKTYLDAEFVVTADFAEKLERELNSAQSENTRLRAALAASKSPCVYCSLPAEEWSKCKQGFPGCGRMDDAMGCPELGASMALEELKERANALIAAGDDLDPHGDNDYCDCIPGDIRLCKHCHEASVNWNKAKAAFTNPI